MAHITNFVPKLPNLSSLGRMMSCRIFRPSNPLLGPNTNPYPSNRVIAAIYVQTAYTYLCVIVHAWLYDTSYKQGVNVHTYA